MLFSSIQRTLFKMSKRTIMKSNAALGIVNKKERIQGIPSNIDITAIGHGFAGTPKCLVVSTTFFRYMFNCGEGTQRVTTEQKKLRSTNRIFFTTSNWENVGGLIGTCLTLEAAELKKLFLYGPDHVTHQINSARYFSKFEKIEIVKADLSQSFTDTAMTIDFVKFRSDEKEYTNEPKRIKLSDESNEDYDAVAYLCKPHAKLRNIDIEKCVDLGLSPGPHFAQLKAGQEITLPGTDKIIKPDDILTTQEPNDPFLIVECPSIEHLPSLTSSLDRMTSEGSKLCLVVHFTNSSVMSHPLYVDWMKRLGQNTRHMILNDLCSNLDVEAIHRVQSARHLIHPYIFPQLSLMLNPEDNSNKDHLVIKNESDENLVRYAKMNTNYIYRPIMKEPFDELNCVLLDNDAYLKTTVADNAVTFMDDWKTKFDGVQRSPITPEDPEICFLGTCSAVPNKYRNVSCFIINIGEESSIMMDCGENSCGQLYRLYGFEEGKKRLNVLKAAFISHLHADHHLGLIGVAIERKKHWPADSEFEPLIVVAPRSLMEWYNNINCDEIPMTKLISFVPTESLYIEEGNKSSSYFKLLQVLGLERLQTIKVNHTQHPHGVVLKHQTGWKIVYSGDTMPCKNIVRDGQDCDLLIHEATFDCNKVQEARMKKHSTCDQAIDVGRDMNAKFILLTHFSQRYDKVPLFSEKFADDVGVAFDMMKVKLSDLHLLPTFLPAYKVIYEKEYQAMLNILEDSQYRLDIMKQFANEI